ncbi:MAG: helix-turn-helix transcriptional regulator, partial [Limisphaerales bacterium]
MNTNGNTEQQTTSPKPSTTKKPGTKRVQKLENRKMTGPQMERMLQIHQQLQANCYPNSVSLKPILEVGKKTIRRDVFYMQTKLKLPIAYDNSRKGWYYTREVLYFPTQIVTESDLHLIAILEQTIGQFSGGEIAKRIQNLLNEFTRALPKSLKQARANWRKVVSIRFPNKAKYNPQHLDFLAQAAASELQV